MAKIAHYQYVNTSGIPVKGQNETSADFEARMQWYRDHDNRVAVPGGKINYGHYISYIPGNGMFGISVDKPYQIQTDSGTAGQWVYDPNVGGSFSVK